MLWREREQYFLAQIGAAFPACREHRWWRCWTSAVAVDASKPRKSSTETWWHDPCSKFAELYEWGVVCFSALCVLWLGIMWRDLKILTINCHWGSHQWHGDYSYGKEREFLIVCVLQRWMWQEFHSDKVTKFCLIWKVVILPWNVELERLKI